MWTDLHYTQLKESGKFARDWGTHTDTINIDGTVLLKQELETKLQCWKDKQQEVVAKLSILRKSKKYPKEIQNYVAQYQHDVFKNVFCKWREIAITMRQKVFDEDMEEEIDVFDLKCKEWGFCLREVFGVGLGTGDYGHLTVEHASMLLRNFRSLRDYSNQGFEAAHKLQKQIYSRATNHDGSGEASSLDQILTHHYAEKLLYLRLCFRKAKECARKGKKFYFRGCGWTNAVSTKKWSAKHKRWIDVMDELFTTFMGKDFFAYRYTEEKSCVVVEEDHPLLQYDDALWEKIGQIKMMERQLVENETPRTRKAKRGSIPKKSRRKLFKIRKRKKNSLSSSVVSSSSSGNTSTKTKGKLQPSSSGFTNKSQKSCVQNTRRCLFEMSKRKRKQRTPLATSSPKRKTSLCSTPMRMTPLSSDTSRPPSLSPLDVSPLSAESSLLSSSASATTPPPSVVSGQPSFSASAATSSSTDSASSASTLQTSHASALPPFDHVFSPSCTREKILSCKLPPVDCSLTVQGVLVSVPQNYIFTDVATLKNRPPARVVNDAVSLIREVRKEDHDKAFIDLDVDDVGVSIGQAGVFSRSGLGQLEWLAEVAEMQYNSKEEKTWLMQTPDNLDNETRDKILNLLLKFPLNYLVAKEGKYSVNVRAFTKLALERYIDDTVIDTAIARLQRQCNVNESFLCLPAHTITWLNTGDSDFIRQCFEEILENVKPGVLSMVLIPVNMGEVHWGLMVVDVKNKEAYFDDGLGWSFSKPSYLHLIINELHLKFPDCSDFSLNAWQNVKAFKRFGMPRQPTDGQVVGSGSCGLGVILSALDFMNHVKPHRASRSWSFNEMTVHRKDIMKLLSSA